MGVYIEETLWKISILEIGQRKGTQQSRDLLEGQDEVDRILRYSCWDIREEGVCQQKEHGQQPQIEEDKQVKDEKKICKCGCCVVTDSQKLRNGEWTIWSLVDFYNLSF